MPSRASAITAFTLPLMLVLGAGRSDILAQDRLGVDQISREADGPATDLEPPQIDAPSLPIPAVRQLGPKDQQPTASQLTEDRSAAPVRQLYTGGPTAQPTEALSRPAEGRKEAGVVQRVAGADRCDAAVAERKDKRCAQVIETRSAEFEKPHPATLTPEQRLLISQQQREVTANTRTLARRLGAVADPQSIEEQGIAATLRPPVVSPPAPGAENKQDSVIDPAVQAIVNAVVAHGQR